MSCTRRHVARSLIGPILGGLLLAGVGPAAARNQHAACRDGQAPVVRRCLEGCPQPPIRCDVGPACDDKCTFVVQQCEGIACHDVNVDVPTGEKAMVVVSLDPRRSVVLRCRRGRQCAANIASAATR